MTDVVSGSTNGTLTLTQKATGGGGGDAFEGKRSGDGGNAASHLTATNPGGGDLIIQVEARGGAAGTSWFGSTTGSPSPNAGIDGSATASASGSATGGAAVAVSAKAFVRPGSPASASAHGDSGTGNVRVEARQFGSDVGGPMVDAVSGSTNGTLTLLQESNAGNAASMLTATNPGGGPLVGESIARGGTSSSSPGGNATASIQLSGAANVTAHADVRGGQGAGTGGSASVGTVTGVSTGGGAVDVSARVEGGTGFLTGSGAPVSLTNAVTGSTAGSLLLRQTAVGGNAGTRLSAGAGGDAFSSLSRVESVAPTLHLVSEAAGGKSKGNFLGGRAEAIADANNPVGAARADTLARGGISDGTAANGGGATASATATTAGDGHPVVVNGQAIGGISAWGVGTSGNGGSATSLSIGTAAGRSLVTVSDRAEGGKLHQFTAVGDGGDATSTAQGSNGGDRDVDVASTAVGGLAGSSGIDGMASASATATTSGTGSARAMATATGSSGTATADAHSSAGMVTALHAHASAPAASTSVAKSHAAVGQPAPGSLAAAGLQAAAFGTGLPSAADANTALAGNPRVRSNFDVGGTSDLLGLVVLGGAYSNRGTGRSQSYSAFVDFNLDMGVVGSQQELLIGLLDPNFAGLGFDTLRFRIQQEGTTVVDETFLDPASALTFFDDQTLNLGTWTTGLVGNLDLTFLLDLTTNDPGAAFALDLLFGNATLGSGPAVPEPSAVWLFGTAIVGLAGLARRRGRGAAKKRCGT